jgi:FixJ family two-component response regulator
MKSCILIDDDELVRMTWQFKADSNSIELFSYATVEEFLNEYENLDRNFPVYLDSDLGNILGEDFVEKLNSLGFNEIHMVTGKDPSKILKNKHLFKTITGKKPPF